MYALPVRSRLVYYDLMMFNLHRLTMIGESAASLAPDMDLLEDAEDAEEVDRSF